MGHRPAGPNAAAGHQRHGHHRPHQFRARAAGRGGAGRRGRGRGRLCHAGVRPGRGAARFARRPRRAAADPADGRGGGPGGQQQRRRRAVDADRARPRRRGDHQPRPAGGDRRRLPHPGGHGPVGRAAGGGRHDQPHPPARLRRGHHRADSGHSRRPHIQLSGHRLHQPAGIGRTGRAGPRARAVAAVRPGQRRVARHGRLWPGAGAERA